VFNLGMGEITVILLLALIFLGPSKLPDLAAGLGKLIKEIRKATSDVKNEIALDDTFRKPFEELRDAVTLHPDELKRRDQWAKEREEAAKRAAEEAAREAAAIANGAGGPPDGLADNVKIEDPTSHPPAAAKLPEPNGPNATIVQAALPRGATLDDIPTPPPEPASASHPSHPTLPPSPPPEAVRPSLFAPVAAPTGTVARPDTLRGVKPAAPAEAGTLPANNGAGSAPSGSSSGVTQILKEEDLIPSVSSGTPPPPPHLPGLRPAGAPRPGVAPPPPLAESRSTDKKKS
jgi:sec-independent protein translocase protein TatB